MKQAYGSMETGYMKWLRLRQLTQNSTESVDAFYSHFRCCMALQLKRMSNPEDTFIFNFMFLDGLRKEINAEVLHLPEARTVEQLKLQDTLELAKRAEQGAKIRSSGSQSNATSSVAGQQTHVGPICKKNGKHGKMGSNSHGTERTIGLTEGERKFINMNHDRGGGLVTYPKGYS
jgi:hypothetical protein